MNFYFDTSALLKLLLEERGSDQAEAMWWEAASIHASRLVQPEARAAMAAAKRAGRISGPALRSGVDRLADLTQRIGVIELDHPIATHAGDLAERHALRGYDAVHLASALAIDDPALVVATWDADLARAVVASGRRTAPA